MATTTRTIRAPRGTTRTCTGWPEEGALRMLTSNLDPGLAERPDDRVVCGGSGKAAWNVACFEMPATAEQEVGRLPMREDRAC